MRGTIGRIGVRVWRLGTLFRRNGAVPPPPDTYIPTYHYLGF